MLSVISVSIIYFPLGNLKFTRRWARYSLNNKDNPGSLGSNRADQSITYWRSSWWTEIIRHLINGWLSDIRNWASYASTSSVERKWIYDKKKCSSSEDTNIGSLHLSHFWHQITWDDGGKWVEDHLSWIIEQWYKVPWKDRSWVTGKRYSNISGSQKRIVLKRNMKPRKQ